MGDSFAPPQEPPPLLSDEQVICLATQGWLRVSLPEYLQTELTALSLAANKFFNEELKTKEHTYPKGHGTESGFYRVETEKEYLTLRCKTHSESQLESLVSRVWHGAAIVLRRILGDLSRGLDLPPQVWNSLLDGCLELPPTLDEDKPSLVRMFRYYPGSGFAAEHTDLGLLTLCVGQEPGLQVLEQRSEGRGWVDAGGPMILTGNVVRVLSGDRIRAGVHRVVANPNGRSSVVFALRPSLQHPIDLSTFGMDGIIHSQELYDEIKSTKFNINATKSIRDRQAKAILARKVNVDTNSAG